ETRLSSCAACQGQGRQVVKLLPVIALSLVLASSAAPHAFGWGAVRGPYGGAAYRGPMGGAAGRGPGRGGAGRGPRWRRPGSRPLWGDGLPGAWRGLLRRNRISRGCLLRRRRRRGRSGGRGGCWRRCGVFGLQLLSASLLLLLSFELLLPALSGSGVRIREHGNFCEQL